MAKDDKRKPETNLTKAAQNTPSIFERIRNFYEEAKAELRKVTWPTRDETIKTSIAVVILVIIMSIYLGLLDWGLSRLVALVLS